MIARVARVVPVRRAALKLKYLVAVGCLSIMAAISSCAGVTPQENYARVIAAMVGTNIDRLKETPLSERYLGNGNVEYRYRYNQGCIEIYEVDPQTRIIKNASYEGSAKWCNLAP